MSVLSIYQKLPYPLRCLAASGRGYYLRRMRYGAETPAIVAEALRRERAEPAEIAAWQGAQLAAMLEHAATRVPFYRRYWESRNPGSKPWRELAAWPVLEKDALRAEPRAFLADGCDPGKMFHSHTSGTTGKPIHLWRSRPELIRQYALFEARWRNWYGVSRDDRWANIGGQLVTAVGRNRPPYWVWNRGLRQLYMSSYHLRPDAAAAYRKALVEHGVQYVWGYSSSLYSLATAMIAAGLPPLPMKVAIANAEPLLDYQRGPIEAAFACPARETYGMTEAVVSASECEFGKLHSWPESGVLEVDGGGTVGDLLATGILHRDMPLIRYRTGDRGGFSAETGCACGRTLPVLARIEGRSDDVLYTRDGRRVGRLDPVFKADLHIVEAQIVQETLDRLRVRYVPAAGARRPDIESALTGKLRERMGPVEVVFEELQAIERGPNGKFRAVICRLEPSERLRAAGAAQ